MLDFRRPELTDAQTVRRIVAESGRMGCEYAFGNIFAWSVPYRVTITIYDGFFLSYSENGSSYCFPVGSGDFKGVIEALRKDAAEKGFPLSLYGVTREDAEILRELYGDAVLIEPARDSFDYIYWTADLSGLPGKKYHAKRNHIAAFEKDNIWSFEKIDDRNIDECVRMSVLWEENNINKNPDDLALEQSALAVAFKNYEALGFKGALLKNKSGTLAFTFGEEMNRRLFCTHFEKAFSDVRGAYPMVNREFARMLRQYKYINREDDTGDDGLRQAKLSYHPAILLEKNTAVFKT